MFTDIKCEQPYAFGQYSDKTKYPNGATFTTGNDGIINFNGLAAGQYYIKELDAPDGYIKDTHVASVLISAQYKPVTVNDYVDSNGVSVKGYTTEVLDYYTVTVDNVEVYTPGENGADGIYGHSNNAVVSTYKFENQGPTIHHFSTDTNVKDSEMSNTKGTELPSTGGIGTTIFYVVGVILVIGAGILLVTKRRMNVK